MRARLVGLLAVTAFAFIALTVLGWRSLDGFEATIGRVLRQASVYTAEQLSERIQRDLQSPIFDLLEQVDHAAIRTLDVPTIAATLRANSAQHFDLIDSYFVWSLAAGPDPALAAAAPEQRVLFFAPDQRHAVTGPMAPGVAGQFGFRSNPALARLLRSTADQWISSQRPFALSYVEFEGHPYQVVFHYLFNSNVQRVLGGVEGFLAQADHLGDRYFTRLLDTEVAGGDSDGMAPSLAVSILDSEGREIAQSGRSLLANFEAEAAFPFVYFEPQFFESLSPARPPVFSWAVRTGYESGDITALAREQATPQRLAWLLASLVAAVGILLTARSAAREMRVSEIKSEFVASISHDLRTPLTKIQLYADTLRAGHAASPGRIDSYCEIIGTQARTLMHLIQGLMDFSKIEAGVQQYEMSETDLGEVIRSALEMYGPELTHEERTVDLSLPDHPVLVLGSFDGLRQAFANVIGNALKYSPPHSYLRIALTVAGGRARVDITDHGIGISAAERRKVFGKYYRSPAVVGSVSGSGIGLAIVRHVVEAHHGRVTVIGNADGPGVTFTVTLPLVAMAA